MIVFSRVLIRNQINLTTLTRDSKLSFSSRNCLHQHTEPRTKNPHDFFKYTSGRWVWDEDEQLRERYREFNVHELQKIAIKSISAKSCVSMEKLGEGSYNKSFQLTMADGETVVARIPNPNAGPAFLTTASEVATMDFLRNTLHLPVSKVLAWDSSVGSRNRVGAEYIIMEHAPENNLADVWTNMDLEHKVRTMEDIVNMQQKLLSVRFSIYGCLFYKKDAPLGSCPAIIEGEGLSHELKTDIAEQFSIGPVVDTTFWSKKRGDMDIDRGPWTLTVDYIQALALREISWIQKYATPRSIDDPLFVSHSQNTPAEHISLLQKYLSVAPYLLPPEEDDLMGSFLWHTDLRTPNIFVDENRNITSIIDWQNPIRFVENTWDGNILPLRESLIRVQKKWDLVNRTADCPINFSLEQIQRHYEDGEGWNEIQDFWDAVSGIMGRDGWTSHAMYDQAMAIYSEILTKGSSKL